MILTTQHLPWTVPLALGALAIFALRWRRLMAQRRIAKGLRTYTSGMLVVS